MNNLHALIQRWQRGDERAAELIYNYHQQALFRLAYGLLGDAADAEEVTQDSLTYALVNIGRFDPDRASFSTWLHMITVSRCRDKRRRKLLPRFSLSDWLPGGQELRDPRLNPEQITTQTETTNEVWQAVQALKRPFREAIILRYYAGHTYREMGEILGCPLPTAQSRVRLAFAQLRQSLENREDLLWEINE